MTRGDPQLNRSHGFDPDSGQDLVRLPVDPKSGEPLSPTLQPGYYPGYSTLSQKDFWDDTTRKLVLDRVNNVPPLRFFSEEETAVLEDICDRVMPQDDRLPERRIPIVNHVDGREYSGVIDGYRFEDMPDDGDAMRMGLKAIQLMAKHQYDRDFTDLKPRQQEELLKSIHDCTPKGADEIWEQMDCSRFWQLMVQFIVEAYYAHPWAWDEIGFGGPAYPRGYMRLSGGMPEPWEVDEARYEWAPPPDSITGIYEPIGGEHGHKPPPSQAGTH